MVFLTLFGAKMMFLVASFYYYAPVKYIEDIEYKQMTNKKATFAGRFFNSTELLSAD
jgi:hypothetical protein